MPPSNALFVLSIIFALTEFIVAIRLNAYFDVNTHVQEFAYPSNCDEALRWNNQTAGIYLIQIPNYDRKFYANCIPDPEGGAGWTLIQRRVDGHVNFFRNWVDYEEGFGDLNNEFFIGLHKLHALTQSQRHELWVKLVDYQGNQTYARYNAFGIGDASSRYALNTLGAYHGNAGDGLRYHYRQKFYTRDSAPNEPETKCAETRKGAWWFKDCMYSHLNGLYYGYGLRSGSPISDIFWTDDSMRHDIRSYNYVHMAIRPTNKK